MYIYCKEEFAMSVGNVHMPRPKPIHVFAAASSNMSCCEHIQVNRTALVTEQFKYNDTMISLMTIIHAVQLQHLGCKAISHATETNLA